MEERGGRMLRLCVGPANNWSIELGKKLERNLVCHVISKKKRSLSLATKRNLSGRNDLETKLPADGGLRSEK